MRRHSKNAEGSFWIDQDVCLFCRSCEAQAPVNIKFDEEVHRSYVFKQPDSDAELEAVKDAMFHCPVEAIEEG